MTNDKFTTLLFGDFNMPNLKWIQSDILESIYIPLNFNNNNDENTIESIGNNGLMQINSVMNDNNRMLDLVWTNEPDLCICKMCHDNILKLNLTIVKIQTK